MQQLGGEFIGDIEGEIADERKGDFSKSASNGRPVTIRDPQANSPFPGNQIPVARFDPVSVKLAAFYPAPDLAGSANNYIAQANSTNRFNNFGVKLDHNLGSNDRLMLNTFWKPGTSFNPLQRSPIAIFGATNEQFGMLSGLRWVRIMKPTLINEATANFSRATLNQGFPGNTRDWSAEVGFTGGTKNPIDLGLPYVNFTPSLGASFPAAEELARERRTAHAGKDGKTGETLLKTVLAPLFAHRNLRVLSWVGHNIFGNRDGQVLDDPANKASKIRTKDQVISKIVGYKPQTHVSIEYIESLDDWKTAWDHIHFQGFLGVKMMLQFTWQGCDSLLAAPLVLDLARLALLAQRRGEAGVLRHLACFFKSPMGVEEHDFFKQFVLLEEYARACKEDARVPAARA